MLVGTVEQGALVLGVINDFGGQGKGIGCALVRASFLAPTDFRVSLRHIDWMRIHYQLTSLVIYAASPRAHTGGESVHAQERETDGESNTAKRLKGKRRSVAILQGSNRHTFPLPIRGSLGSESKRAWGESQTVFSTRQGAWR